MKKQLSTYKSLCAFIKENESFQIVNNKLFCNHCNIIKNYNSSEGITPLKKHLISKKHIYNSQLKTKQKRLKFCESTPDDEKQFHLHLLKTFIDCNIPLKKLENKSMNHFLEKYTNFKLMSESHYRKTLLNDVFEEKMNEIKQEVKDKDIYLMFDETTDACGRYILNILVGVCSNISRQKAFLIKSVELNKTNSVNINQEIVKVLNYIYENKTEYYNQVRLILSDGASYALKAGRFLKELLPNSKHIICLCHAIHNLCETIRYNNFKTDRLIVYLKTRLLKNKKNQEIFKTKTNINIPSWPIITRWGTWIKFSVWIFNNFDKINDFIMLIAQTSGNNIDKEMHNELKTKEIEQELKFCNKMGFLVDYIINLENESKTTESQIEIIKNVIARIKSENIYYKRFFSICSKNPDLEWFLNYNSLKCKNEDKIYAYVPLTNVQVERSFSMYRDILSDKRKNFITDNLEKYIILYYNASIKKWGCD